MTFKTKVNLSVIEKEIAMADGKNYVMIYLWKKSREMMMIVGGKEKLTCKMKYLF